MTSEDIPVDPAVDPDLEPPASIRRIVGEPIEVEDEPSPVEVTELTTEERNDFASLLTCGRRFKTVSVMGHPVKIQTLKTGDEMRIGLFTKKYLDSQLGFQRSYQVAVCAAGVRELQGKPLFSSLSPATDEDEIFAKSVETVQELYPIVVTQIFTEIMNLEREFAELAIKLGKLKG